jgi:hypothetical protein
MKWRTFALLAVGLVVLGALLHRREAPAAVAAGPSKQATMPRFVGVATCTSSACHHKDALPDAAGCEYTTWIERDKHAQAYSVLFGERSRQIVAAYNQLANPKHAHPEKEALCLRCHSTDVPAELRGPRFSPADGVGCESCHGPAEKYVSLHYLDDWKTKSRRDKELLGFMPTKNLAVRAGQCAACHVGSGAADVNHDLIAAGHPRLNFELANYHAKLPRHWKEKGDNATADFESRLAAIGRVVSARDALRLLEHRASRSGKVWPEFAEYDCVGCHHLLSEPSTRPGSKGLAPWSDWYYAALPAAGVETKLLDKLRSAMQKPRPQRETVAPLAHAAAGQLEDYLGKLTPARNTSEELPRRSRSGLASLLTAMSIHVEADDAPKGTKNKFYWSVETCRQCHEDAKPPVADPVAKCNEYPKWRAEKHADAFAVLNEERGKKIGKTMKKDVTNDPQCLSCHAAHVEQTPRFRKEDGVSCTICHGPYQEWKSKHGDESEIKTWRDLPRPEKEDKYGMTDLWHPAKRANLCSSCHVGNAGEGKVVTHEMYAAGHPPLPSFELGTFVEAMPAHWELLREKNKTVQGRLKFVEGTLEQTELVVLGGVTNLKNYVAQLQSESLNALKAGANLDLAQFDCYACHHDLKNPSWRQQRGFKGKPGRVPMRPWPAALVRLGTRQAAGGDEEKYKSRLKEVEIRLQALADAFVVQPYGDNEAIAKAAAGLVEWCDRLLLEIDSSPDVKRTTYNRDAAERLLRELCSPCGIVDYESARQIAWAFKIIYAELHRDQKEGPVREVLKQLDAELHLELPVGRENNTLKELNTTLTKMNAYDPERFSKHLGELRTLLQEPQNRDR